MTSQALGDLLERTGQPRVGRQAPSPVAALLAGGECVGGGMRSTTLTLGYPPSVNHYWRHVGSKILISAAGRAYRSLVQFACMGRGRMQGKLEVKIVAHPPDKRRRDIDNLLKSLLDALQHAGMYEDDFQIAELSIARGAQVDGGKAVVTITEII